MTEKKTVLIITTAAVNVIGILEEENAEYVKIRIPYVITPANQAFGLYAMPGVHTPEEQDLLVYEFAQSAIVFIDDHPKFTELHSNLYSTEKAARSNIVMAGKGTLKH